MGGVAVGPSERHYLFVRLWLGLSDRFPFEQVDGVPDEHLAEALNQLAQQWESAHKDLVRKTRHLNRKKRLGASGPPGPANADQRWPSAHPHRPFWEIAGIAGWREGLLVSSGFPTRQFYCAVGSEELARLVTAVLQERHPRVGVTRAQYGILNGASLEEGRRIALELSIEERQRVRAAGKDALWQLAQEALGVVTRVRESSGAQQQPGKVEQPSENEPPKQEAAPSLPAIPETKASLASTPPPSGGHLTLPDLVERFHVPARARDALRKMLERWRRKNQGFIEDANRGSRKPTFLYELDAVRPAIEEFLKRRSASGDASAKRPSGEDPGP